MGRQARKRAEAVEVVLVYSGHQHCGTSSAASEMGLGLHTALLQFHLLYCSPDLYDLQMLIGLSETLPDPLCPPQQVYHGQRESTGAWSRCYIDHGGCAVCAHCPELVWERHLALQERERVTVGETAAVLRM